MNFLKDPQYHSLNVFLAIMVIIGSGYFIFSANGGNGSLLGRVISGYKDVIINPNIKAVKNVNTSQTTTCVLDATNPHGTGTTRYCDVIFSDSDISMTTYKYATAPDIDTNGTIDLYMDVYTPNNDSVTNRPLAFMLHGGGGTRTNSGIVNWCKTRFAGRGYVCASIDYRGAATEEGFTAYNQKLAQSDLHSAIRYIRANASTFGIDPNMIILGGSSAGGITAVSAAITGNNLSDAYFSDSKVDIDNPNQPSWSCASFTEPGAPNSVVENNMLESTDPPNYFYHGTDDMKIPYQSVVNTNNHMISLGIPSNLMSFDAGHDLGHAEDIEADVMPRFFDWVITQGCPHSYMNQDKI